MCTNTKEYTNTNTDSNSYFVVKNVSILMFASEPDSLRSYCSSPREEQIYQNRHSFKQSKTLETLEKHWKNIGKTLEKHWKNIGKTLEKRWKNIGKTLEKHWKTFEKHLKNIGKVAKHLRIGNMLRKYRISIYWRSSREGQMSLKRHLSNCPRLSVYSKLLMS